MSSSRTPTTRHGYTTDLSRPGHTTRLTGLTRLSQSRNYEIPQSPRSESRSLDGVKRSHKLKLTIMKLPSKMVFITLLLGVSYAAQGKKETFNLVLTKESITTGKPTRFIITANRDGSSYPFRADQVKRVGIEHRFNFGFKNSHTMFGGNPYGNSIELAENGKYFMNLTGDAWCVSNRYLEKDTYQGDETDDLKRFLCHSEVYRHCTKEVQKKIKDELLDDDEAEVIKKLNSSKGGSWLRRRRLSGHTTPQFRKLVDEIIEAYNH